MSGRRDLAVTAARKLVSVIPEQAFRDVPALEDFRPMPLFAMVRFGMWDEILAEPQPPDDMQYTIGIWHWARGMADLRKGQLDAARAELQQLTAIADTDAMKSLSLASFPKAATLLGIAADILDGEILNAQGHLDEAVARLQAGAAAQDELAYTEPPAWFYPVRHNLGAVLLAANRLDQAEAVYREDLRQYPDNGWSLIGLSKTLRAEGKVDEAADVEKRLAEVWKDADVTPSTSRF
jgi:tetratricopeptide (TPR) repeat protein